MGVFEDSALPGIIIKAAAAVDLFAHWVEGPLFVGSQVDLVDYLRKEYPTAGIDPISEVYWATQCGSNSRLAGGSWRDPDGLGVAGHAGRLPRPRVEEFLRRYQRDGLTAAAGLLQ